jgi:pimeloyl-ACP methyl ester carboxylesterase
VSEPALRTLSRDGVTIGYRVSGSGKPLLLLHATLSSARQLAPLADRLGHRFRVIAVDRRGSGESPFPAGQAATPVDVDTHVSDLEAVLAAEEAGPVLVAAHSYGACVSLELAARRPGLASAVWAYEPPFAPAGPPDVQAVLREVGRLTAEGARAGGREGAARAFLTALAGRDILADLPERSRARILAGGDGVIADGALAGLDPDGLANIRVPTVIAGGGDSQPFYASLRAALAARIPGATLETFEGAGHEAPITQPDRVAVSIEALAARIGW